MYMLDTDICIYVLKKHSDKLRHKFKVTKNICISSVTYGELCFGIENGDNSMKDARWKELNCIVSPRYTRFKKIKGQP